MAKLSREEVLDLAKLCRLHLSDSEIEQFQGEIGSILEFVERLNDIDLSGIEPTYQVSGLKNVTRPDIVKHYGATPEELLSNVPEKEKTHIKVKRMVQ